MTYILAFGNKYLDNDNLAIKVLHSIKNDLPGFKFIECSGSEELFNYLEKDFIILDVVDGIKKVQFVDDKSLSNQPKVSAHDFDLGFLIRLMRKMGRKEKIRIIGIPIGYGEERAREEVIKLLHLNKSQ